MLIRRFFAFVISAFLIFFPVYSYATTSVGGWSAGDVISNGLNTTINATKGAGASAIKSAITIAPSAANVGKHLIKGGGSAALAFAMVELADGAIDWILDPANNSIKYKNPAAADNPPVAGVKIWHLYNTNGKYRAGSANALCQMILGDNWNKENVVLNSAKTGANCYDLVGNAHAVDYGVPNDAVKPSPTTPPEYITIPAQSLGSKVVANAQAGHAPSQEAVKATALEGFAAGDYDAALNAAAVPDTGVENPPDTENPPTDAPVPFDPSSIIAAINSLKAMLAGILSSMTGFFDWMKAPVPPDEENKDVPFATTGDVGLDSVDRYEQRIDFSGQCPVNDFSFTMMGVTYAKPIPYYHFCGFLEQIAPWLLAMCYLGTAYFVVENI